MSKPRHQVRLAALTASLALALTACGGNGGGTDSSSPASSGATSGAAESTPAQSGPVEVTDLAGDTVTVPEDVDSVVATDNRVFATLEEWDVDLSAAPIDLMFEGEGQLDYVSDESIVNLGNHREPNLEAIVAAEPDLVLNGQRFSQHKDAIAGLLPEGAALVDTNIDTETQKIDEGLKQLTTLLGEIFGQQAEAEQLNQDFDDAIAAAKDAYNSEETVAGLITSGGEINYSAPTTGRTIGPLYDVVGLTPAFEQEGSGNHQGDDVSVEAIAQANPDWLIIMDRDAAAAAGEDGVVPARELIAESEALKDVTAVKEDKIIYLEPDFYVNEDIHNYTELLNTMAESFSSGTGNSSDQ